MNSGASMNLAARASFSKTSFSVSRWNVPIVADGMRSGRVMNSAAEVSDNMLSRTRNREKRSKSSILWQSVYCIAAPPAWPAKPNGLLTSSRLQCRLNSGAQAPSSSGGSQRVCGQMDLPPSLAAVTNFRYWNNRTNSCPCTTSSNLSFNHSY